MIFIVFSIKKVQKCSVLSTVPFCEHYSIAILYTFYEPTCKLRVFKGLLCKISADIHPSIFKCIQGEIFKCTLVVSVIFPQNHKSCCFLDPLNIIFVFICKTSCVHRCTKLQNTPVAAPRSIIDCIVFPPSQLGTFPTSLVGTFPVWKMGMQLYISAASQHAYTVLTAVEVLVLPLYYLVCVCVF